MAGTEGPVVFCLHGGGYSGYAIPFICNTVRFVHNLISELCYIYIYIYIYEREKM
jgi:hypothetical protein